MSNSISARCAKLFGVVSGVLEKLGLVLQPFVLLWFRFTWGWQFFQTGKGKLENHPRVVEFFSSLGIPLPDANAWFIGGLECIGGACLLLGLLSRPVAFLLCCNMIVAYLSVPEDRIKLLGIFSNPDAFTSADPFFFLLTALLVLAFGPGLISLDRVIKGR